MDELPDYWQDEQFRLYFEYGYKGYVKDVMLCLFCKEIIELSERKEGSFIYLYDHLKKFHTHDKRWNKIRSKVVAAKI